MANCKAYGNTRNLAVMMKDGPNSYTVYKYDHKIKEYKQIVCGLTYSKAKGMVDEETPSKEDQ